MRLYSLLWIPALGVSLALAGCGGSYTGPTTTPSQPPSTGSGSSNAVPGIGSVKPASLVAGSATQTITLSGTGFVSSSVVSFNGTALATTY